MCRGGSGCRDAGDALAVGRAIPVLGHPAGRQARTLRVGEPGIVEQREIERQGGLDASDDDLGEGILVVTADRALRDRVRGVGAATVGPGRPVPSSLAPSSSARSVASSGTPALS